MGIPELSPAPGISRALRRGVAAGVIGALATMVLCAVLPLLWGWQPYLVATGSMTPLIRPGDVVIAAPYDGHRLATGAVVVVAPPRGARGMVPLTHGWWVTHRTGAT